ncbi:hypothetical protein P152DRAFT_458141 [Eremomyces bilateralis CBS 781.70]|uniref:Uncharacterized protein n=1 Tax=Eremomyces bilateralis CBS 781.70 TaxID=1392243 RepID=A0A6G1G4M3_9PEZI|nr:uncharacterized protein P152DRAFT_458141 [Eremomyces bilateralis CBS 781.70]KAF1812968.1 hypothetical protein P152DRAFT_458141 [Eremomyces bilateralis CBS 781.70]
MTSVNPPPAPSWSEDELIEALALLENMQEQLDLLRTIPAGIIRALGATHLSPEDYFQNFLVPAHGGSRRLNKFSTDWHGAPVRGIVEHASAREKEDADLSAGLTVPKYGWRELARSNARVKKEGEDGERGTKREEVEELVKGFDEQTEKATVNFDKESLVIKIQLKVPQWKLRFVLNPEFDDQDHVVYQVECVGSKPAQTSITRCMNKRPAAGDLQYLLDMIGAYQDAPFVTCAICNKTVNQQVIHPTGRRRKEIKNDDGTTETVWEPYHESCT